MQKIKTVKIELEPGKFKDFKIKELSIADIIELTQTNSFFKAPEEDVDKKTQNGEDSGEVDFEKTATATIPSKTFIQELQEYGDEISKIMEKICDFDINDLRVLAPSDVRLLFDGFQEVNRDFLGVLEKLKILEMFKKVLTRHMSVFSKMLAIL